MQPLHKSRSVNQGGYGEPVFFNTTAFAAVIAIPTKAGYILFTSHRFLDRAGAFYPV